MKHWFATAMLIAAAWGGFGFPHLFANLNAEPSKHFFGLLQDVEPGNPIRGKEVFQRRCTGCHALNADREGPRLSGVYGRNAGSLPGFTYSKSLKNSGITWTDASLDKWLSDPDLFVADNNMSFSVPKAEERKDVIAFLKQQSRPY